MKFALFAVAALVACAQAAPTQEDATEACATKLADTFAYNGLGSVVPLAVNKLVNLFLAANRDLSRSTLMEARDIQNAEFPVELIEAEIGRDQVNEGCNATLVRVMKQRAAIDECALVENKAQLNKRLSELPSSMQVFSAASICAKFMQLAYANPEAVYANCASKVADSITVQVEGNIVPLVVNKVVNLFLSANPDLSRASLMEAKDVKNASFPMERIEAAVDWRNSRQECRAAIAKITDLKASFSACALVDDQNALNQVFSGIPVTMRVLSAAAICAGYLEQSAA